MDEVYCQKKVQYSNGMFYGMAGNEITKSLLCLMIKSIRGKYRDVISMILITNINATILYTIWESNINALNEIGFNIVATITDGHERKAKFLAR